jgi:trehalose-phosphatase
MMIQRGYRAMRHLFENWSRVGDRLRQAPIIALFLDFDGTLVHLRPRPEHVSLEGSVRQALAALVRSPRFRIWVISGRRQADVRARVRVPGIRYLGLHGWEGRADVALAAETGARLYSLSSCLELRLARIPAVWIENKQYALTVHYRGVAEADEGRARSIVNEIVAPYAGQFRISSGKKVWEILPRELADKGVAVKHQLAYMPGAAAVYVGDDQVDEPAFAALPGGITIHVGASDESQAR